MAVTDASALRDQVKAHEAVTRATLPRRAYTVVRVDGRAFRTFLRQAATPFDPRVARAMDAVAVALCEDIAGAVLAYVQSDEASVLVAGSGDAGGEPWFGGVVQKIASVSAAVASVAFNRAYADDRYATFNVRVLTLPGQPDVAGYFLGRQQDAIRNAVSMAAQARFPHQELHGLSSSRLREKLLLDAGVSWDDYPQRFRLGGVVTRVPVQAAVMYTDKRTGAPQSVSVTRFRWTPAAAPLFARDEGFLPLMIPPLPSPEGQQALAGIPCRRGAASPRALLPQAVTSALLVPVSERGSFSASFYDNGVR